MSIMLAQNMRDTKTCAKATHSFILYGAVHATYSDIALYTCP